MDISKAREKLDWAPTWELNKSLDRIVTWHKAWLNQENMYSLCLEEIKEYMKDMNNENS